ncbi:MAG: SGNH/GDSL hydrolase family protein [Leptonema sp. (in: bacteria)]
MVLILLLDFFLKFNEAVDLLTQYKKFHCLREDYLFLCPDRSHRFKRGDNHFWKVSTNSFGERITLKTQGNKEYPLEVWFIGDSISFGYWVDDEFTVPYLLEKIQNLPVRNLGVDSLGTRGIQKRLEVALQEHSKTKIQNLIWIYNTSDFLDDEKQLSISKNHVLKIFYKIHYLLGRNSNLYNALWWLRKNFFFKQDLEVPEIQESVVSEEQITFKNIQILIDFVRSNPRILNFLVIVYPGMNLQTKKPDIHSKTTEMVYQFFRKNQIQVLDVRKSFLDSKEILYFEFDGHPNEKGYALIAKSLIDFLRLPQSR